MGANKTFRSLEDFGRHDANIQVRCRCKHTGVVDAGTVTSWFMIHRWPRALEIAHERFRCSACGRRGACELRPCALSLPLTFPRWGPHTDQEWKERVRRLRG